jgi:hypothetical protein
MVCEVDHSAPYNAEVNKWSYKSTPPLRLQNAHRRKIYLGAIHKVSDEGILHLQLRGFMDVHDILGNLQFRGLHNKVLPVHTIRAYGGIAPLILNLGTRWR